MASSKNKKSQKVKISRKAKIIIGIVLSLAILCGGVLGLFIAWKSMFRQNDRFMVLRVNVTSADGQGRWHGNVNAVKQYLENSKIEAKDIEKLQDEKTAQKELLNIFDLDLKKLREELEKIAEIEKVEVRRVLPDTLDIQITERIPVAVLESAAGKYVVDKDTVVMLKEKSIDIAGSLPVIISKKEKLPQRGEKFEELRPVLEFIQLTKRVADYAVLKIVEMDISKEGFVSVTIYYSGDKDDWFVFKDVPVANPSEGLDRILNAIEFYRRESKKGRVTSLRFKGQAVSTKEEEPQEQK